LGIKDRITGKIYAKVMLPNESGKKLTGKQLISVLDSICKKKVAVITDDFRGYDILNGKTENKYQRYTVNHSIGQYSAGNGIHTNGIENFWSIFKRGWYGIYHHMSVKFLQSYVNEYCFRNNYRDNPKIYDILLKQSVIKEKYALNFNFFNLTSECYYNII
jgi:transposase-like protein